MGWTRVLYSAVAFPSRAEERADAYDGQYLGKYRAARSVAGYRGELFGMGGPMREKGNVHRA